MAQYEYWAHHSGEHYLIRRDEVNEITGVCGPLRQADIPTANRHHYDYDAQPQHTAWIRAHLAEFRCIVSTE